MMKKVISHHNKLLSYFLMPYSLIIPAFWKLCWIIILKKFTSLTYTMLLNKSTCHFEFLLTFFTKWGCEDATFFHVSHVSGLSKLRTSLPDQLQHNILSYCFSFWWQSFCFPSFFSIYIMKMKNIWWSRELYF